MEMERVRIFDDPDDVALIERPVFIEEWRWAVGYEGSHQVSSEGRVRSVDRTITNCRGRTYRISGRLLKQGTHMCGYRLVVLCRCNAARMYLVHRLVLEAFGGPSPEDRPLCLHTDGSRTNNYPENLRWGTASENQQDRRGPDGRIVTVHTGLVRAAEVKRLFEGGVPEERIAIALELSLEAVHWIVRDQWWPDAPWPAGKRTRPLTSRWGNTWSEWDNPQDANRKVG